MKRIDIARVRDIRRKAGMNQHDFWRRFGITQSGGSRYESGRNIPTSAAMLIWLREAGAVDEKTLEAARKAVSTTH